MALILEDVDDVDDSVEVADLDCSCCSNQDCVTGIGIGPLEVEEEELTLLVLGSRSGILSDLTS